MKTVICLPMLKSFEVALINHWVHLNTQEKQRGKT